MIDEQKKLTNQLAGQVNYWKSEDVEASSKQLLVSGNRELAREIASVLEQACKLAVNIGLGLATLSSIGTAGPAMVAVYVGITVFPMLVSSLSNRARVKADARVVEAEQSMQSHLTRFWDNTVIGNPACRSAWETGYQSRVEAARKARAKQDLVRQVCHFSESVPASLMQIVQNVPWQSEMYFGQKITLVTSQNVMTYSSVSTSLGSLWYATSFARGMQGIARKLEVRQRRSADIASVPSLLSKIKPEVMTLTGEAHGIQPAEILNHPESLRAPGLRTLRAANGAGKTAFLSLCRQHFGDDAFFLPAAHKLDFGLPSGSTGQTVMRILAQVDALAVKPPVILLDEWDANLDPENTAKAQAMIGRWSTDTCVLQVRNKPDPK